MLSNGGSNNTVKTAAYTKQQEQDNRTKKIEKENKTQQFSISLDDSKSNKKLIKHENDQEDQKNELIDKQNKKHFRKKTTKSFPIPLALTILIVWIAFSAAMFCLWETEWGYLTSVYFFFVSIRYNILNFCLIKLFKII